MKQPIDSRRIQRTRRRKINPVEHQRWAAYATAALATSFSFGLANSAEARIHYSGHINEEFDGDSALTFPLGDAGVIKFEHVKHYFGTFICTTCSSRPRNRMAPGGIQTITVRYYDGGSAFFGISAPSGAVRGGVASDGELSVSRLLNHDVISAGPFVPVGGFLAERSANQGSSGYPRGEFQAVGPGAIGFKFNTGAGVQYGWARVRMDGFPNFTFRLVDYAYGDPGEVVKVGRQRSNDSAPAMESLGGLALGATGLLAWRRRRAAKRAAV